MSGEIQKYDSGAPDGGMAATEAPAGGYDGGASPPASIGRRAEIEAIMRSDFDRYEREGLDRELGRLIEAELAEADPDGHPGSWMTWQEGREALRQTAEGRRLAAEWEAINAFSAKYRAVQDAVRGMVSDFGNVRRERAFAERFDRLLPERVRFEVYRELANGGWTYSEPVDEAGIRKFSETPIGVALVEEWGSAAADNIGRIWARAAGLRARLGEDWGDFAAWFDGLHETELKSVLRIIAR